MTDAAPQSRPRRLQSALFALVVLIVSAGICVYFIETSRTTERVDEKRTPKLVQTRRITPTHHELRLTVHGVVVAARELTVRPEMQGRIVEAHESLVEGGLIRAQEVVAKVDPSDYEIALTEGEAGLEEAKFELAVERGRQVVAEREWKLLEGELTSEQANRSLALREPHLKKAQSLVSKAEQQIAKARLDLARTTIPAPFNAVVISEDVEVGQLVQRGAPVCTLVGSDEFWIRVSVPLDRLASIRLPAEGQPGAEATIFLEDGTETPSSRQGRVIRRLGDLDPKGQMARALVRVRDPLGLEAEPSVAPLLLGSFLRVEIEAGRLESAIEIDRSALREGGRIWVVGSDHKLEIREVEVLWRNRETVLVAPDCIGEGEELIVSGLRLALPGMPVSPQNVDAESEGAAN